MRAGLLVMVLGVVTSDVAPEQAGRFTALAREIAVDLDAAVGLAQAASPAATQTADQPDP